MLQKQSSVITRMNSLRKLLLALVVAVLAWLLIPIARISALSHLILAWDIFCVVSLSLNWLTFYTTPVHEIRQQAPVQDDGRLIIFFLVLIATSASMLAVISLMRTQAQAPEGEAMRLAITLCCMIASWLLVHSIFTLRYAHLYYDDHPKDPSTHAGGLNFPGEEQPDFVDFAYFSLTLGMTFQVSDVEISSRRIRRLALWHSFIAFSYNATVIALTVNVIAGLTHQ
jgi:uncharacterized membrane protein